MIMSTSVIFFLPLSCSDPQQLLESPDSPRHLPNRYWKQWPVTTKDLSSLPCQTQPKRLNALLKKPIPGQRDVPFSPAAVLLLPSHSMEKHMCRARETTPISFQVSDWASSPARLSLLSMKCSLLLQKR